MSGKLGDILIQQAVIDEQKLIAALADQRAFGGKLGRTLVDLGYVTEEQLVQALATQLGLTTIDLEEVNPPPEALACLPADACKRYGVFPIRVDPAQRLLWVATAEPEREPLGEVARIARHTLEPVLCTMSSIDRAIKRYYRAEGASAQGPLNEPSREELSARTRTSGPSSCVSRRRWSRKGSPSARWSSCCKRRDCCGEASSAPGPRGSHS